MATALLIVIFIAFIGLGVPDSLFGTAWPAIYAGFGVPVSWANFVTVPVSACTVFSSLMSARLVKKFGTGVVTAASTVLTALALLGFSLSGSFAFLCVCALPLGLGAGAIDTALNNYVATHYKASHMNFLHCFYGVGVSLSPFLMSLALSDNADWHRGYFIVFFVQAGIAALTLITLPLWYKVKGEKAEEEKKFSSAGLKQVVKIPALRRMWIVFFAACAAEYTCGSWGSTFLVESRGLLVDSAALAVTFYYAGLALGRFVSGLVSGRVKSEKLVWAGQFILLAAVLCALVPNAVAAQVALFFAGFGIGPVFPNLIHLTPANFGEENSQAAMSTQMAASYVGIMLMPSVFGLLADAFGAKPACPS